jgi:hypothetical protein
LQTLRSSVSGNYHKKLLPDDEALNAINKIAGEARTYHAYTTLPWNDNGQRMLTTAQFVEYKARMSDYERQFNDAVTSFIPLYNREIS